MDRYTRQQQPRTVRILALGSRARLGATLVCTLLAFLGGVRRVGWEVRRTVRLRKRGGSKGSEDGLGGNFDHFC